MFRIGLHGVCIKMLAFIPSFTSPPDGDMVRGLPPAFSFIISWSTILPVVPIIIRAGNDEQ